MRNFLRYTLMLAALALWACGGDSTIVSKASPVNSLENDSLDVDEIDSALMVYSLGSCTGSSNGRLSFVMNDGSYYQCVEGLWLKMAMSSSSKRAKSSSSFWRPASSSSAVESSTSESSLESSSAEGSSSSEESSSSEAVASSSSESSPESSSEESLPKSSSSVESSSSIDLTLEYDCTEYSCVYKGFLNKKMLGSGMYGQFLDTRDGQVYRTVKIGSQTWMAQNLNYISAKSRCYLDEPTACYTYGRLYYQEEALTVCPEGWHLPSPYEWDALEDYAALEVGYEEVGNSLKSVSTWTVETGTDLFGFSGLASRYFGAVHVCGGAHGVYWTSIDYEYRCLLNDRSDLYTYWESYSDEWGMSVRCILDD